MIKIRKILSNIYILSTFKKFNVIIFGVISTALLNRYLGPAGKGEYAYLLSISNIMVVLFNVGINMSYPNFKRRGDKEYLQIFQALSILEFVLMLIITVLSYLVTGNTKIFIVLLLTTVGIFRLQLNYYNLIENIKGHTIITILSSMISLLLIITMFQLTTANLIYAYTVYILKDIFNIVLSLKNLKSRIHSHHFDLSTWKEIILFGLVPMYTTLLISINYKIDVILLSTLGVNISLIGLYTVGVSLAEYGWLIPDIFKDVMINKTAIKDDIKNMSFSLRISSSMMMFIFIGLVIFGKSILLLLFGAEFTGAYAVTVIIFFGIYSMIYCKIIGTLYIAKGQWKFYSYVLTVSVISNIVLNFIFIPSWGINGAALASVVSYTIAGAIFLIDFKKTYSLKYSELLFVTKNDIKKMFSIFNDKNVVS